MPAANREKILRELGTEALAKGRAAEAARAADRERTQRELNTATTKQPQPRKKGERARSAGR